MAQIAIHHNPFHLHRNVDIFTPRIGQTIRGWLDERGIAEFSKPTICIVDGEPVLRKDWSLDAWATLATETHTAATNTAIRRTYKYPVPEGRYEVQVLRTNNKDTSARAGTNPKGLSVARL